MRRYLGFLLAMSCGLGWSADSPAHPKLHAALNAHLRANAGNYFGAAGFKAMTPAEYRAELVDLNGDSAREALVLMLGRHWGGTGGQSMLLFRGMKNGFGYLGRMTCITAPMEGSVCVMDSKTAGWRDLAVRVRGHGAQQKYAAMKFSGARYPLNPPVQPVIKGWPDGEFVLISGDGTVKALAAGRTHFTGLLGKATRLQMGLKRVRGKVTGTYFYEKYGTPIGLEGEASGDRVVLREKLGKKVTATLTLAKGATGWIGEWRSADGRKKYPLRFKAVATEMSRKEEGPHESSVQTAYPQFASAVGRRFNKAITKSFLKRFIESVDEFEKSFAELARDLENNQAAFGESFKNWTFDDSAKVRFFSADLISIRGSTYQYMGGAHGNYGDFPVNYWWRNGTAREVKVADLFDARKPWRAVLGRHLRCELIRQEANYVVEGSVKEADLADSENFTFSPAGVEFHFSPYEVGPYAQGAFHVTVPFTVLRPVLRADGPLARWAK